MTLTCTATAPSQYRTGKTLGSGTYAIVKEAIHIETGKYYACKVIDKKLMEGKEYMVKNEVTVLKRVSMTHRNIVNLYDHFETSYHLYLYFDLCTGGELLDRISEKGSYHELEAVHLVRTILQALDFIHSCHIVHGDIKPENLLFRNRTRDSDIAIVDFGLSRIVDPGNPDDFTEICGTTGYMAPEIYMKTGHSKPVDIWAMGVVTYFLLCGYTPFKRYSEIEVVQATITGDYRFEPTHIWSNITPTGRDFISKCLTLNAKARPTARDLLQHAWFAQAKQ